MMIPIIYPLPKPPADEFPAVLSLWTQPSDLVFSLGQELRSALYSWLHLHQHHKVLAGQLAQASYEVKIANDVLSQP